MESCVCDIERAALYLVEKHAPEISRAGITFDNRQTWAELPTCIREAVGSDRALPVVTWYLSVMDGTGAIERDFGKLKKLLDSHSGPLLSAEDLTMLNLHLPESESAIVQPSTLAT